MTTDDIVERIRKLLRLAKDAGATEAEAASALERANALLIRHNLSMDALAVSTGEQPAVGEQHISTGWAGSWRGSLLGVLARHNLCAPFIIRDGKHDTGVVVGRPANVQVTHAMYKWIAEQLEHFAMEEWLVVNRAQRDSAAAWTGRPWCPECEDWTEYDDFYAPRRLMCLQCSTNMVAERPIIHCFSWKTAFYRGAVLRISNRLYEQRKATQIDAPVTALMLRTEQENADWIRQHHGELHKAKARSSRYVASAYERGKQRGGDVNLAPQSRLRGDATA